MTFISRSIGLFSFTLSLSCAGSTIPTVEDPNYIDDTHKNISETVVEWADIVDHKVSSWVDNGEDNETDSVDSASELPKETLEEEINYVDSFFQTGKYLDETDNTYILLRTDSYFQSKESADFGVKLRAQMPFRKSKRNLKIFIEDVTADNARNVLLDKEEAPSLGINYYRPETYGINSKYSLGLSGIDPYVRVRYNKFFKPDNWYIDIAQTFQYSTDDKFEEDTNLYFDRQFEDMSLLRLQFYRATHQEIDGMDYGMSIQYYFSQKRDNTGLRLSQTFFGNTKYPYMVDDSIDPPLTKTYGGINNYTSTLTWRRNIWRKWFYYEVRPAVSFQKLYDWDPNYTIRIFFDFYFGKFDKI